MNPEACLAAYNGIIKENDELYRDAAKALGLPDCAFWILYSLRAEEGPLTQGGLCHILYQPKQTVNSALKKLEHDGYLCLTEGQDRRSKQIRLTPEGERLAAQTVDRVIALELRALCGMAPEDQADFLRLFRQFTGLLRRELLTLSGSKQP